MKTSKSLMAVALTLAVAIVACVGISTEAFAAVPHVDLASAAGFKDFLIHNIHIAAIPLAAMRTEMEGMTKRMAEIMAENQPGLDADKARKLEEEHAELTRKAAKLQEDIEAEVRRLAEEEARRNSPQPQPTQIDDAVIAQRVAAALEAERVRTRTIRELATNLGVPDLGNDHAGRATTVDQFRSILLDHLASEEGRSAVIMSNTRVQMGETEQEKRAVAIENAIEHRIDPTTALTAEGRNFRGMTLIEIARDVLEQRGVRTRGMSHNEIAGLALQRMGGLHTTSDFPGILGNVINRTLRAAYTAAPQTFRPLVRITSVSDFKTVTRAQLGEAPSFDKVNEHGEFKRGTLGEGSESYKIATYGKIVGVTRQVLINDDLNAFSRLPQAFGVQAAQLESDLVWGQILLNAAMGDGNALFSAAHNNLAGSGAAISVDSVSAGRTALATQTGLDGKTILGLSAAYMLVPVALQTKAEQFRGQIYAAKNSDVVPDSLKNFGIISEPRLDAGVHRPEIGIDANGSTTSWYLAGSIAQGDMIELAYLDGNQGVYTETRTGFDIDGMEVKVRLDVGAKPIDWRNLYKNPGA